jgi:hypothetical protein
MTRSVQLIQNTCRSFASNRSATVNKKPIYVHAPACEVEELASRPASLWVFHVTLSRYRLGWRAVIATIVAGIVYHAIMIGSAAVFVAGRMDVLVLDAIQVVNSALILLIVGRLGRKRTA